MTIFFNFLFLGKGLCAEFVISVLLQWSLFPYCAGYSFFHPSGTILLWSLFCLLEADLWTAWSGLLCPLTWGLDLDCRCTSRRWRGWRKKGEQRMSRCLFPPLPPVCTGSGFIFGGYSSCQAGSLPQLWFVFVYDDSVTSTWPCRRLLVLVLLFQSLEWTGWISLKSKGLSRVFSNTTVQKHQFFGAQLSSQSNSHIHTWPLEKP